MEKSKEKQLKKAFSSLVVLPKISNSNLMNISNIKSGNLNKSKKETFLTITTDDIGFAMDQNNIIEKKILNIKKLGSKPWETSTDNDIYNPYWTRNRNIIRQIKDTIKSDGNKFNVSTIKSYKKYFRQKTQNIFINYSTAKNYKFKDELKMKYSQLNINPDGLISNIKKICYNNFVLDLIKEERSKISTKELGYQKALNYEEKILRNDIKSFEEYKSQEKEKLKKLELELLKKISENSSLFEVIKLKLNEHRMTLAEIRKYLKSKVDGINFEEQPPSKEEAFKESNLNLDYNNENKFSSIGSINQSRDIEKNISFQDNIKNWIDKAYEGTKNTINELEIGNKISYAGNAIINTGNKIIENAKIKNFVKTANDNISYYFNWIIGTNKNINTNPDKQYNNYNNKNLDSNIYKKNTQDNIPINDIINHNSL